MGTIELFIKIIAVSAVASVASFVILSLTKEYFDIRNKMFKRIADFFLYVGACLFLIGTSVSVISLILL